jgi:hypothetical protein
MQKILTDENYQQELTAKGKAHAACFSWKNTASGLIEIYRNRSASVFGVRFFSGTMDEALQKITA